MSLTGNGFSFTAPWSDRSWTPLPGRSGSPSAPSIRTGGCPRGTPPVFAAPSPLAGRGCCGRRGRSGSPWNGWRPSTPPNGRRAAGLRGETARRAAEREGSHRTGGRALRESGRAEGSPALLFIREKGGPAAGSLPVGGDGFLFAALCGGEVCPRRPRDGGRAACRFGPRGLRSREWPPPGRALAGRGGRTGWNIYRRWGERALSRGFLRGRGLLPPCRPWDGGRSRLHALGEACVWRKGGLLARFWGGEGEEQTKSLQVSGERTWSTAPCEGWGQSRRFLGTGNGRSAHLGVGGWRFEGRGSSPPDFGAGSDKSSRPLQVLGERGLVPLPSAGEEAAPTAFGAEGRGVYAPWGGRGALRQRVPPG